MANQNLSNFAGALKTIYTDFGVEDLTYKTNPLYALLPKWEEFYGDSHKVNIHYGNSQNVSTTFANALAGTSVGLVDAFYTTRQTNYSIASLSNELLESTKNNEGSFITAAKFVIDGAMKSLARQLAIQVYRSGTGKIGRISATAALNASLTLANPSDHVNFEAGQVLVASTADGTGSAKTAVAISAIDRVNGILTMASDVSAVPSWAASDYLFLSGNYNSGLKGLESWIPYDDRATKLAASFFGVTRTADSARLGGVIYDASAQPIEEGLQDAMNKGSEICEVEYEYLMMHPMDYSNLIKSLGSKVQYTKAVVNMPSNANAQIGFDAVQISYNGGIVKVIGDRNCPRGRAFALSPNYLQLASLGKATRLFDADGNLMLRETSADGLQIRCFSYSQVECSNPGAQLCINL